MKILVTGGSGFLGKRLIELLLADHHEVIALGRHPFVINAPGFRFVTVDLLDRDELTKGHADLPKIDTIIHMAALVPHTKDEDQAAEMCNVNVRATINLLETFGVDVQNIVYASTAEVYGLPEVSEPITESLLPVPLSNYGASKLAGELFCRVFAQRQAIPISMLRFTVLYGPHDLINRAVPNFINNALQGRPLEVFGGEELRDYLHVGDAAQALYLAAKKPVDGVFNVGTGKGISIRDTATAIAHAIDPNLEVKVLPRTKPASDIVLNVTKIEQELGFKAKRFFPDLLDEQVSWHKQMMSQEPK